MSQNPFQTMVETVIGLIDMAVTPLLLLIGALGTIYCVILGVRLARASEPQEQHKAKDNLKNAIVGFVLIFILVVVLKVGINPLTMWMEDQAGLS